MIVLAPVVAPIALEGLAYISAGVAGFLHAAWTTQLQDSGQLTDTFNEQYTEIDLRYSEFNESLTDYETEQKQTVEENISQYISDYVPPSQAVSAEHSSGVVSGSGGLIGTMRESAMQSIQQQKILNNNLIALNGTLASLLQAKNSELINQNQSNAILNDNLLALNKSMATLATLPKVTAEVNTSPKRVITTGSSTSNEALGTLAEGVADQIATNAKIVENLTKKNDHLDFLKDGTTELKDSNGNQIKPREVEAKNNAEHHIDKEALNTFDSQNLIDALESANVNDDTEITELANLLKGLLTGLDKTKFNTDQNQTLFKVEV